MQPPKLEVAIFAHHPGGGVELLARSTDPWLVRVVRDRLVELHRANLTVPGIEGLPADRSTDLARGD